MLPNDVRAMQPPIRFRYPRIIRLMQFAACLSVGEAESCIRDFKAGDPYSGEAVNHFGGTRAVMDAVLRLRTKYRLRVYLNGHWHSTCRSCVPELVMRQENGFSVGGSAFLTKHDAQQDADDINRQPYMRDFGDHRQIVEHCTDRYCTLERNGWKD